MFMFGHLGFGQLLSRPWQQKLNWLSVAVGSLVPDLIDKPLFYLFPLLFGGSRLYAHTLLFLLAVTLVGVLARSKTWLSLAVGIATHLLVDNLGDPLHVEHSTVASLRTLFWPLFGWQFPDALRLGFGSQVHRMLSPYFLTTEMIGLAFLAWFARANFRRRQD